MQIARTISTLAVALAATNVAAFAQGAKPAPATAKPPVAKAKEAPPAPGTPKDVRIPARKSFDLPNGLKVTMVPYGRVPKAAVQLSIRTGRIDEGPQDVSLGAVTTDMLLEGTATRTAQDISRQSAEMGGSLNASGGTEATTISGEVLSEFGPKFIALVADVVRNPKMADADLKRVIDRHARDNAMALAQPSTLTQQKFAAMTYGDHPFARMFPTEAMLRGFTVSRVKDFHAKNFGAKRAHLYISGVFDADAMEKAVRTAFADWPAGAPATENPPKLAAKQQLELIDRPGAVQSSMWLGVPAASPKSGEWAQMEVTDALLGGAFGSRITSNIREAKGYTYSPGSFLLSRKGATVWVEVADVTTNVTGPAITEIFGEMNRLRTEAPPAKELDGIKANMAGIFTIQNSSRNGIIGQLQFGDLHELGDDYISSYVKKIMAVTPEDVRRTAEKHLDPSKVSIAIVGDKKVVEPQLGKIKPVVP